MIHRCYYCRTEESESNFGRVPGGFLACAACQGRLKIIKEDIRDRDKASSRIDPWAPVDPYVEAVRTKLIERSCKGTEPYAPGDDTLLDLQEELLQICIHIEKKLND